MLTETALDHLDADGTFVLLCDMAVHSEVPYNIGKDDADAVSHLESLGLIKPCRRGPNSDECFIMTDRGIKIVGIVSEIMRLIDERHSSVVRPAMVLTIIDEQVTLIQQSARVSNPHFVEKSTIDIQT